MPVFVEPIHIVAPGACTPLASDWVSSAAGVRSGLSRVEEFEAFVNGVAIETRAASVPFFVVNDATQRAIGLIELVLQEIDDGLSTGTNHPPDDVCLLVGCGEPLKVKELKQRLQTVPLKHARLATIQVIQDGESSVLTAIEQAQELLDEDKHKTILIVGVHSGVTSDVLASLATEGVIFGDDNPWGIVSGEACAGFALCKGSTLREKGWKSLASVLATGHSIEPRRSDIKQVTGGAALTTGIQDALQALPDGEQVGFHINSLGSERWRAEEFAFAAPRLSKHFHDISDFIAPSTSWGDAGAATDALLVQQCIAAGERRYAVNPYALAWMMSRGGKRASILLRVNQHSTHQPRTRYEKKRGIEVRQHTDALFKELLEETEMSYETRTSNLDWFYTEGDFRSVHSKEARIEAAIDGLGMSGFWVDVWANDISLKSPPEHVFAVLCATLHAHGFDLAQHVVKNSNQDDPEVVQAIAEAFRFSENIPIDDQLKNQIPPEPPSPPDSTGARAFLATAVSATRAQTSTLRSQLNEFKNETFYYTALGLIGDPDSVPTLLEGLANDEVSEAAAQALEFCLGAGIFTSKWKTEVLDDAELFEDELKRRKQGDGDVGVYRHEAIGVSTSAIAWGVWWKLNAERFEPGKRYRAGVPISATACAQSLEHPLWSRTLRNAIADELKIRYQCPTELSTALSVKRQLAMISSIKSWAQTFDESGTPGAYYLHGTPA